jgi:hypothetical protein
MSVSQPNSAYTSERATSEFERRRVNPATPIRALSKGWVTRVSTSSGARPGASVRMMTVGFVRSGSTSTGSRRPVCSPSTSTTTERPSTIARFASDHWMSEFNMVRNHCVAGPSVRGDNPAVVAVVVAKTPPGSTRPPGRR